MDLNLDGIPVVTEDDMRLVPVVAVRQNVYQVKIKGLAVHSGKTATALRIVPLPELVTTRLRARSHGDEMSLTDRAKADRMGQAKFLKDTYVSAASYTPTTPCFSTRHCVDQTRMLGGSVRARSGRQAAR